MSLLTGRRPAPEPEVPGADPATISLASPLAAGELGSSIPAAAPDPSMYRYSPLPVKHLKANKWARRGVLLVGFYLGLLVMLSCMDDPAGGLCLPPYRAAYRKLLAGPVAKTLLMTPFRHVSGPFAVLRAINTEHMWAARSLALLGFGSVELGVLLYFRFMAPGPVISPPPRRPNKSGVVERLISGLGWLQVGIRVTRDLTLFVLPIILVPSVVLMLLDYAAHVGVLEFITP